MLGGQFCQKTERAHAHVQSTPEAAVYCCQEALGYACNQDHSLDTEIPNPEGASMICRVGSRQLAEAHRSSQHL